jgi:uncharacterized membrane protein YeaQ/YmgE (transglycosylase-associated protein family)
MRLQFFMLWVPMGLLAGGLAPFVMRARGYGLIADVVLGLAGSLIGTLLFFVLESSPEAGWLVLCVGAFLGAASAIVGQRYWYARAQ